MREALLRRGWCENTTKESQLFDLKWTLYDNDVGYALLRKEQIVNHYQNNSEITAKGPLCRNMRSSWWVTDVNPEEVFPRCFHVFADTEWEGFVQTFYLTAAQGLLAMFAERAANGSAHVWTSGTLDLVRVAARVSEHRVRRLRHEEPEQVRCEWVAPPPPEEDGGVKPPATAGGVELMAGGVAVAELERMLQVFYQARDAVRRKSQPRVYARTGASGGGRARDAGAAAERGVEEGAGDGVDEAQLLDLEQECRAVLGELGDVDPQFHMTGQQNVWIIKASNSSKGVGIKLFDKLAQVQDCKGSSRVLQKYVERPLLLHTRKFDLRCWVLVTDWNPLSIWLYDECIARICADAW